MFDSFYWIPMPFHFWTGVYFIIGVMVGSFLNVCIHRMPRDLSLIRPGSRCPACHHAIPWRWNIPLFSWLLLRGRCAWCSARISPRYFLVELLTASCFVLVWLAFGRQSWQVACAYCVLISGLIGATFIDFEHFIIPDEFTFGGILVGCGLSFLVPGLHDRGSSAESLKAALVGAGVGAGVIYSILRLGKLLFGRQHIILSPRSRVYFTESAIILPDDLIPYGEMFYRRRDTVRLHAHTVEMVDRCYRDAPVQLTQHTLRIGEDEFSTEEVAYFEVLTDEITIPREAMGLGDVKFMAAIGAFLGWPGVIFSLMGSALVGSLVGVSLILAKRHAWSSRIPYGPYIAAAAVLYIFAGKGLVDWWLNLAGGFGADLARY